MMERMIKKVSEYIRFKILDEHKIYCDDLDKVSEKIIQMVIDDYEGPYKSPLKNNTI